MLGPPRVEVLAAVKLFEVEEEKESQPAACGRIGVRPIEHAQCGIGTSFLLLRKRRFHAITHHGPAYTCPTEVPWEWYPAGTWEANLVKLKLWRNGYGVCGDRIKRLRL